MDSPSGRRGQRSRPLGHEYPEHHRGRPPGLVRLPRRGRARKWTRWRRGSLRAKAKCSVVRGSERLAGSAHRLATRASTALVMASFAGTERKGLCLKACPRPAEPCLRGARRYLARSPGRSNFSSCRGHQVLRHSNTECTHVPA